MGEPKEKRYVISACLLGAKTRFDGTDARRSDLYSLVMAGLAIPLCPEQLGGLPTPRHSAEIKSGDGASVLTGDASVVTCDGADVTVAFIKGATEALKLAKLFGAKNAILKSESPSCGCTGIFDGSFSHTLRDGDGVFAAMLRNIGLEVVSDEDFEMSPSDDIGEGR